MFSNDQINIKTCVFMIIFFLFSSSLIAQHSPSDSKYQAHISENKRTQNAGYEVLSDTSSIKNIEFSDNNFLRPACQITYSVDTIKACDSYTWQGITYTSSNNIATWIGVNSEGCDSVVTLNLTITPTTENSITEVTCDSYTWYANEETYTETGTYTYIKECEIYTLDLTITPTTINITTDSACESYIWVVDGITYTNSGTFTSVFGCHMEILKLKVYPLNNVTYSKICDLSSYTWLVNGQVYNTAGTYTHAYNNVLGCPTVDTLNLILLQNLPASVLITSSVNSDTITCGSSVTFTATPTNGGDAPIYQWKLNGIDVGLNSPIFTTDSLRNEDVVSVVMISYDALPTAILGEQQWSTVNLNLGTYRNGDVIPQVTDSATWANLTTGAWCYYNNDSTNGTVYGKLYNWYAINDPRGLAPPGYHIPTTDELNELVNLLGGENNAGALMIESNGPDGFEAKPAGACLPIFEGPHFFGLDILGYWWTSTLEIIENEEFPIGYGILFNDNLFGAGPVPKYIGFSARCIRDEIVASGCYSNSPASSNPIKFTVIPDSSVVTVNTCDSYIWQENGLTYNNSGIYTVPDGCNVKVLDLTITPINRDTTNLTSCDSYHWSLTGQTYSQSGIYSYLQGCNTSYLNLIISPSSTDTTNVGSCDMYAWSTNGQSYSQSGMYSFVSGCHTSYLNLIITASSSDTLISASCDSYFWSLNSQTYTTSGVYSFVSGCYTSYLNLNITASSRDTLVAASCDSYFSSANSQTYTQSGVYSFVSGCHTSYLNLTITASSSDTLNTASCDSYFWSANSQIFTQSGVYSFVTGCYTSYLNLTITSSSIDTLIAASCDSYVWSANSQTYTASGIYSFVSGCHTSYLNLNITASSSDTLIAASCDSYVWSANGQIYTASGVYSFVSGCFTSYLNLTITASSSDTLNAASCDSYLWSANSQIYTASGVYSFVSGCFTSYLNLTITPSSSDTLIIASCDSYVWSANSQTFTSSGMYSFLSGCHSSYLDLAITASSRDTTFASSCNSYVWSANGQTYTQSGSYSLISNCRTLVLQLIIKKSTTGDTTAFACSNFEWYGTNYTSSSNPTHTLTNAAGCDSILTLHLTIKSKSYSSNTLTVCDSLRWNGITYSTSGIYTWTGTNAVGCDSITTLNLIVNKTSLSATAVSASSTAVNAGTAVTLSVVGGILGTGANWKWYKDSCNGLSIGSGSVISVTPNKNTIYFVRAEGTCNITSCVSVSITLNCGNNSISSNVTNNTICSGSSITLTAIGNLDAGAQWRWDINCDSVPQTCDPSAIYTTSSSTVFSPTVTTTYYLQSVGGACGASSCVSITVFVTSKPASPALISGNKLVCSGTNYNYSISSVLGATGYTWTVPANSTIVSGQGTTNLTLSFTSTFTSGTLSVVATNCGGSSTAKTLSISKLTKPSTPGTISGTTSVCPGTNFNYSISSVFGATSYTWTAPANSTIISGQGTTNITIAYATGFNGGTLCVIASNCGGNSTAKTLTITKATAPVAPSSISGPTKGVCQQNSIQYSTVIVSGATSYNWTVSSGATITSGQGTNVIVLNFSSTASNSNITLSVSVRNNCGVSTAKSISISTIPSAPCVINGNVKPCKNANLTYSVGTVYGASSYTWTVPSGWSILSGQNTAFINVKTGTTSGSISVKAKNNCGSSTSYSITTSITNCTGREVADQNSNEIVSVINDIILFPNPSSYLVNFNVIGQKPNSIEIYNVKGQKVLSSNWTSSLNITSFIDDVYFVNFIYNNKKVVKKKLIKN